MYDHPLNKQLLHIRPTDGMMFDCTCYQVHAIALMWGYPLTAWQAQYTLCQNIVHPCTVTLSGLLKVTGQFSQHGVRRGI